MTNTTSGMNTEIKVNGQKLETVTSFKYLGSVITNEGSKPEILSRIAQTTAALIKLKPVWNDRSISVNFKIQLMHSLVTAIFLYSFESWTLTAELQRRSEALEMRCYHKILHISHKDHVTKEEIICVNCVFQVVFHWCPEQPHAPVYVHGSVQVHDARHLPHRHCKSVVDLFLVFFMMIYFSFFRGACFSAALHRCLRCNCF